ncbi:MAG: Rpn family recombination-promoting nuclease/putative transposase [Cyanobacteria bacterium J06581_3]
MQTDHIFYELLRTAPDILLKLLGQSSNHAYEFRAVEVKQTAFRLDGVLMPDTESAESPVILVEVQYQRDVGFYRRFFSEIFLFLRHNPKVSHWQAVAIFERRSREPKDQNAFRILLDSPIVHRIYLEDFKEISTDSLGAAILQLMVTAPKKSIAKAKAIIARAKTPSDLTLSESQVLELIETIVVYKFPKLDREEIATMLGTYGLKQTRVYQDALKEGRQEGQQEGQRKLILKLLSLKLGELPEALTQQVEKLSDQQINALSDRFLDLEKLEDLKTCLAGMQPEETPETPEAAPIDDASAES